MATWLEDVDQDGELFTVGRLNWAGLSRTGVHIDIRFQI